MATSKENSISICPGIIFRLVFSDNDIYFADSNGKPMYSSVNGKKTKKDTDDLTFVTVKNLCHRCKYYGLQECCDNIKKMDEYIKKTCSGFVGACSLTINGEKSMKFIGNSEIYIFENNDDVAAFKLAFR